MIESVQNKRLAWKFLIAIASIVCCMSLLCVLNIGLKEKLNNNKTYIIHVDLLRQIFHQTKFSLLNEQYLLMEIMNPESKKDLEEMYAKHIEMSFAIKQSKVLFANEISMLSEGQQKDILFDSLKTIFYRVHKYFEDNGKSAIDSIYLMQSQLITIQKQKQGNYFLANKQNSAFDLINKMQSIDGRFDASCEAFCLLLTKGTKLTTKLVDAEVKNSNSISESITLIFILIVVLLILLSLFFAYYIWKFISVINTTIVKLKNEIGNRIQAEETLKKSEFRYETLIKTSLDGFWIVDNNGRILEVNEIYCSMIGYSKEKILTMRISDLDAAETEDKIREHIEKINKYGWDRFESRHRCADGKIIDIELSTSYIFTQDIILVFIKDVTLRKLFERELINSNKKLKELNLTKDKFFSIIAHDLKNPFAGLLSSCELLKRNIVKQDLTKIEKNTESIYTSSRKAYTILEDLLNWAKLQMGNCEVKKEKFNIHYLICDVLEGLQNIAEAKEIKFIISDNVKAVAFFDIEMFKSIVRNFATNAIKFSSKGEKIFIEITEFNENYLKISIKDTGVGINIKDMAKLFRIDISHTTYGTADEKGTGLGLILCKDFAEKNGSEILVESEANKGSTFSFTVEKVKEQVQLVLS